MEMVQFIPPRQRRTVMEAVLEDQVPVIIKGSDGSGKGAIARYLHRNGPKAAKPLLDLERPNEFAENLIHAQGGTLVISDLKRLSSEDMTQVLRFLAHRTVISPSTGLSTLSQTRLIFLIRPNETTPFLTGKSSLTLLMPDLKERMDEFEDIAQQILFEFTHELHKEHIRGIHYLAMARLKNYNWPGNLRELRNVLSLAVVRSTSSQIQLEDLPQFGDEHPEMRANRGTFEKTYLEALIQIYGNDCDKISQVTRSPADVIRKKILRYQLTTIESGNGLRALDGRTKALLGIAPENSSPSEPV